MSQEREYLPIVIYPERGKFLRANGAAFLLGGGLALLALAPWHSARFVTRMLVLLSRMLLLVWGWFCIPALARLLFPKPVVTINDEGISYHAPIRIKLRNTPHLGERKEKRRHGKTPSGMMKAMRIHSSAKKENPHDYC